MARKSKFIPLPGSIKVGYQDFKVGIHPIPDSTDYHGYTKKNESEMMFTCKGNPVEQANTVIHECLHAIWHIQGLQDQDGQEERIVNALANGLTGLMRDNPGLVKFLLDRLGIPV